MLGTKQPLGNIDDIVARLRLLPRQSGAQQFPRFLLERAPMFGRARSQPAVQGLVDIPYQQTDHATAAPPMLAITSKRLGGRQLQTYGRLRLFPEIEAMNGNRGKWLGGRRRIARIHSARMY